MPYAAIPGQDVYAWIKEQIRLNKLTPTSSVSLGTLAQRCGSDEVTVRDAVVRLSLERFVSFDSSHQIRILPIDPDDMAEVFEILQQLEPEASYGLAAKNLSADLLAPLEQSVSAMEQALASRDFAQWSAQDELFHRGILQLYGNQRLLTYLEALFFQAHRARCIATVLGDVPDQSTREHREIVTHILAGNAGAARAAMQAHRDRVNAELLDILRRTDPRVLGRQSTA